jgi:phytoene dehydrogenase-like protein
MNTLGYYKEGLAMASVFTVSKRSAGLRKGVQAYVRCSKNVAAMFRVLKDGSFPERSMAVLSCPSAAANSGAEHMAGTVRFLVPKGVSAKDEIEAEAVKVLKDMDQVVPGFYEAIVSKKVYTPWDYVESFGFVSTVTPVADSVHYEKAGVATPLPGLYCVGATVLPAGGCAASAVESGRAAARLLLKKG